MIKLKTIYSVLLAAYILMSLLIPLAGYNKLIFIGLVLIYGGYLLFFKKEKKFECLGWTLAPVLIIGIFVYGFIRGLLGEAEMTLAKQFLLATSMFVLIYPIEEFEIDMNSLLKIIAKLYIVAFAIYAIYAMNVKEFDIPGILEKLVHALDNGIIRALGKAMEELGSGLIKHRSFFGGRGMQIYLGSTPFLLVLTDILFIDFLRNKKLFNLVWVALSLMLTMITGSRTLMLLIPASLCLLIWAGLERKKQIIAAVILGIAGVAAFVFLLTNSNFFSLGEQSNSVKVGHILSYFDQLNFGQVLIGDGLASYYYSTGTLKQMAHTEITLMDHCRYFGVPLSFALWGMLLIPKAGKLTKNWKQWKIWQMKEETLVFLLYLFFAQTNPVLFNSFGLVSVLWYWNVWLKKHC